MYSFVSILLSCQVSTSWNSLSLHERDLGKALESGEAEHLSRVGLATMLKSPPTIMCEEWYLVKISKKVEKKEAETSLGA